LEESGEVNSDHGSRVVGDAVSAGWGIAWWGSSAIWAFSSGANCWARSDPVASQVAGSSGAVVCSLIAFLTSVEESVSAFWLLAGLLAFVGGIVVVVSSIAFLSWLDSAVSADGSGGVGVRNNSSVEWLNLTRAASSMEHSQLLGGNGGGLGQNEPLDLLGARWGSERTSVGGNRGFPESIGEAKQSSCRGGAASAVVGDTVGGAAIDSEVTISGTVIASFSEEVISDTITANWEFASGSAAVGGGSVVQAVIALLTRIDNTVTAERKSAAEFNSSDLGSLGSARVGGVGVVGTVVALLLGSVPSSVTALPFASGGTAVVVVGVSVIALLLAVNHSVTEGGDFAGSSAWGHGLVAVGGSKIALLSGVLDSVSAGGLLAGGTAGVGEGVVVVGTPVAFFSGVHDRVSAEKFAS